jgi:predicted nucleic acid-binding protein
LVDTNRFADLTANHRSAHELLQQATEVWFSVITVGELLAGFSQGKYRQANEMRLAQLLDLQGVGVLSVDRQTAEIYSTIWHALRRQGTPIPTNDIWIAAQALQHDLTLYTRDLHFEQVPRLKLASTSA